MVTFCGEGWSAENIVKRKQQKNRTSNRSRINIVIEMNRWNGLRDELGCVTNREFARLLLHKHADRFTATTIETKTRTSTRSWFFGWFVRYYYKTTYRTIPTCCPGYSGDKCLPQCHEKTTSNPCNINNAGMVIPKKGRPITCSGGVCVAPNRCHNCNTGYYADNVKGYCKACTPINNCNIPRCTELHKSTCDWCEGEVKPKREWRAYAKSMDGRQCQLACSWRHGTRCYPGKCGGEMLYKTDCRCSNGFGGDDCATFSKSDIDTINPQIPDPELQLHRNGKALRVPKTEYKNTTRWEFWTNDIDWSAISVSVSSSFQVQPNPEMQPNPEPQPYINKAATRIGIDSIIVSVVLKRGDIQSNWELTAMCKFESECKLQVNNTLTSIEWNHVLNGAPFEHLDLIKFTVSTTNGGEVHYYNREDNTSHHYNIHGITVSKTYQLGFDREDPYHCYQLATSCGVQPLFTPDYIKSQMFEVTWDGWLDQTSGLREYDIEIYGLEVKNKNLTDSDLETVDTLVFHTLVQHPQNSAAVNITQPGSYFVQLAANDWAGNYKIARRIFLFDDKSKVDLQGDLPVVITAANETNNTWINHRANDIHITWTDRFINKRHVINGWLHAVEYHDSEDVIRELDDIGRTSLRSTSKVHNILGIVKFRIGYNISYGVNSPTVQTDFMTVPPEYFDLQKMVVNEELIDGKRLIFIIRGYDVMEEYAEDNVTVTIDMTPPIIYNLWLTKGDILNVSVHNVQELNTLTFEWEVYDIHSGLDSISWRLFDNYTNTVIVHGNAHETPQGGTQTLDECEQTYSNDTYVRGAKCYCTPFDGCFHQHYQVKPQTTTTKEDGIHAGKENGVHESDYFIEITAINRAFLKTVLTKKITIDTSPPHAGAVNDGDSGQPEVDFQQTLVLNSHWSGFFDKESGVWFYMYGYDTACLDTSYFDLLSDKSQSLTKTYSTNGQLTATVPGTYYVTVAAYNHALDHSVPVCSDGVTIDTSAAEISEIVVKGAVTREGLIKDNSNRVWVIHRDRVIEQIKSPSKICRDKATLISEHVIYTYPVKRLVNGNQSLIMSSNVCEGINGVNSNIMSYIISDKHLELFWNVTSGRATIHDFEIGLSTQSDINPDKLDFVSTKQHQHVRIFDPDVWDGQEFYILLKAITKAAVETTKVIGPFTVDTTKPDFSGTIDVIREEDQGQTYLVGIWDINAFEDHGDPSPLDYRVALGSTKYSQNVMLFQQLSSGGSCVAPVSCTAIHIDTLPWRLHEHHSYYVTIKATNAIGLYTLASSDAYIHDVDKATEGVVFDIDTNSVHLFQDIEDIDFQARTDELTVRWSGFHHPHQDIVYYACLSVRNTSDYKQCERATLQNEHTFKDLDLIPYTTYYQSIIAETNAGNVTVMSDGVAIIVDGDQLSGIIVHDGVNCKEIQLDESFADATYHHAEDKRAVCQDDVEYQSATNQLHGYWAIPDDIKRFTPDVHWAIEERAPVVDHWKAYTNYTHIKTSSHLKINHLFLQPGRRYRISIKLCANVFCFTPVHSNGLTIVPNTPVADLLRVAIDNDTHLIRAELTPFIDPDVEDLDEASNVMDHYEWAFTDNSHHGRLLSKWKRATIAEHGTMISFDIPTEHNISFTKCWKISVRGYTKAGLSAVVSSEIKNCSDVKQIRPNVVIDAVGQPLMSAGSSGTVHEGQLVSLEQNNKWTEVDRDYTTYHNIISSVWPTLRYKKYGWAVLSVQQNDPSIFHKSDDSSSLDFRDPCTHPDTIKCGMTDSEYMNAFFENGELTHGRRYMVCIHANATENVFEKWTQKLDEFSICSDGITVDLTPPIPQPVWIGYNVGDKYQTSTSDISVNWKSFIDVEEEGKSVHASGIETYGIALGSSYGGVDIADFVDVGLTNHHTFHGLLLQNGHSYFATVRARDFTNQSSDSVSSAVKVDITPPEVTTRQITIGKRHITDITSVSACWEGVFLDTQSGISHYTWSVGTHGGYDDIMEYTQTFIECAETNSNSPLSLIEGHAYFVTVKAYNNAGLYSTASSWAFIVDASPPVKGHIYDGSRDQDGNFHDVDYITSDSVLEAHWSDFNEQHGSIKEQYIHVGSCQTCDDILVKQPIGIINDIKLDKLYLSEGMTYYVTVTACNSVDLCTSATSDGVIVDSSPPTPGRVLDGIEGVDIQYQASRIYIGAQWYGFSDPQSGISQYVWRVGTVAGKDDILVATDVHLSEEAFIVDLSVVSAHKLPVGIKIFTTVRAYNKAGMVSESISNGFVVDNTLPTFKTPLTQVRIGSIIPSTSILRSVLKVAWDVEDSQSFIDNQYLAISSHKGGDFNISSIKVEGIVRDYTFTGLDLHDGSRYDVTLISCNGAKLCTESHVRDILVDSSPPTSGTFAINTDHASVLEREPATWMTWTILSIRLAWLGFEDEHSGITKYMINVGSTYMGNDLNKISGPPYTVMHNERGTQHAEGFIQAEEITTQSLAQFQSIYVSLWAENAVGLSSPITHAQFNLVYGGMLELVRRCTARTCYGHCVCAPHGEMCHTNMYCNDVTDNNSDNIIEIKNFIDLSFPDDSTVLKYSPINSMLAAKWRIVSSRGRQALWYEWSVGLAKENMPTGIFDEARERVWHDAGQTTSWIVSLQSNHRFLESLNYTFFVRVWYDGNTYAIFKSAGLLIYSTPPQPVAIQGRKVKEIMAGDTRDRDFISNNMLVYIDWNGKFQNTEDSLWKYSVYISTHRGGHDCYIVGIDIPKGITHVNITGLTFVENTWYYSVVQAYNHAGLHTTECSDGFMLDNDPPSSGVVYDGEGFHDIHALNSSSRIPSFWHGFTDAVSGIKSYDVCLSSDKDSADCNIHPWFHAGIATKSAIYLNTSIVDGITLYSSVRAFDAVGHVSVFVKSNGVAIDSSPPRRSWDISYRENIITNPSFETTNTNISIKYLNDLAECETHSPTGWVLSIGSCVVSITDGPGVALDGDTFVIIKGKLYQDIDGTMNGTYRTFRLTFFTSHISTDESAISSNEGVVEVNKNRHVFLLYNKPANMETTSSELNWHKHTFYIEILDQNINIAFTTIRPTAYFALDQIQLEELVDNNVDTDMKAEGTGHIKAHTVFIHDWSSIHANWKFEDQESGIVEFLWAIGTVKGGTQLQDFTSVGRRNFAYAHTLHLMHDTIVYVTVVAVNGADLRTISYSDPIHIDLTPPEFEWIHDGNIIGEEIDFQRETIVSVNWGVIDKESDIETCEWAIGSQPKDTSIHDYTTVVATAQTASFTLPDDADVSDARVYVGMKCTNKAGLTTFASTDGVMIVKTSPSTENVLLEVVAHSQTQYPVHGAYHGDSRTVRFRWTGFSNDEGIDSYLVSLDGKSTRMSELVGGTTSGFTYSSFTNLHLVDGNYTVSVTAMNHVQMYSRRHSTHFYVLTQPPQLTGKPISQIWTKSNKELDVSWPEVFTHKHPMYFEVTLSQIEGGDGDILQWQETVDTTLAVTLDTERITGTRANLRVSVRAISHCGLFTTAHAELLIDI